jgi:hypothetical protein
MTALATINDVLLRLGRDITSAELQRLDVLLTDASSRVRRYCDGQTFTQATTTERLPIGNGIIRLPQRPVVSVASVTAATGGGVTFQWNGLDEVYVYGYGSFLPGSFSVEPWVVPPTVVDATYTHGYAPIPDDIVGVVCAVVMRALGRSPTEGALTSETIQGYSYSVGAAGAAGAFGLLDDERDTLDAYKRRVGSARTDAGSGLLAWR